MSSPAGNSEVQKFDRCIVDGMFKFLGGSAIGSVLSVAFFRWKFWPVILCSGAGLGIAYNNCELSFNDYQQMRHKRDSDIKLKADK